MCKKSVLVLILVLTLNLGGCGSKQGNTQVSNSQVNKVAPSEKTPVNKESQLNNAQSQNLTINPFHPIVFVERSYDGKLLNPKVLGGYHNNKWYQVNDFDYISKGKKVTSQSILEDQTLQGGPVDTDLIEGNETFKFYSSSQLVSTVKAKGSKPTFGVAWASGQTSIGFEIDNINTNEDFIIGVNGDWNALPREPKVLSDNSLSVDLDNDNIVENIIASIDKTSRDHKVVVEVEKGSKRFRVYEGYLGDEKHFKMMALDLNGDGKMEVIVRTVGPAGGISIAEIKGNEIKHVLGYDSGE